MWAAGPEPRRQAVLFPLCLDEVIDRDHAVRRFDALLGELDWSDWEQRYHGRLGQPAIHPRVLCGVILWGLMNRIRPSRSLEEALRLRLDFRWLVEGRSIDHTTLSEFRRAHGESLKRLFVQLVERAVLEGDATLSRLGYDGTRVRANNRRSGTLSVESLRRSRAELRAKFEASEEQAAAEDSQSGEWFGGGATGKSNRLEAASNRANLEAVISQLDAEEAAGGKVPKRLPTTDPSSRVMPNKDGGFSPNYTPVALTDIDSGLIVGEAVLNRVNEDDHLVPLLAETKASLPVPAGAALLTDPLNGTTSNAAGCGALGVDLYSPTDVASENPAVREDPKQAVPESAWDRLPRQQQGRIPLQLAKESFVYVESEDCYYCPLGKRLAFHQRTSEPRGKSRARRERRLYRSVKSDCDGCGLRSQCVTGASGTRTVSRDKHESAREAMNHRMATAEGKALYTRRAHPVERVFAVIKQQFGLRQMLLRGLERVAVEWRWATLAFNVQRLLELRQCPSTGPPVPLAAPLV